MKQIKYQMINIYAFSASQITDLHQHCNFCYVYLRNAMLQYIKRILIMLLILGVLVNHMFQSYWNIAFTRECLPQLGLSREP